MSAEVAKAKPAKAEHKPRAVKVAAYHSGESSKKLVARKRPTKAVAKAAPPIAETLGRLTEYKLMSIFPKAGDHQQASIRNSHGHIFYVNPGDTFEGIRVVKIDAKEALVTTAQGVIR